MNRIEKAVKTAERELRKRWVTKRVAAVVMGKETTKRFGREVARSNQPIAPAENGGVTLNGVRYYMSKYLEGEQAVLLDVRGEVLGIVALDAMLDLEDAAEAHPEAAEIIIEEGANA